MTTLALLVDLFITASERDLSGRST